MPFFLFRLRVVAGLLCLLAVALPLNAMAQGRRVALVIGNSAYEHAAPLANPVNDADAMAATLRGLGFQVTPLRNLRMAEMRRALRDFSDAARGAELALLFFAGHGMQMGQRDRAENYLIPVDARLADARDVDNETMGLSRVLALMDGAAARVVILDACRDNPLIARMAHADGTRSVSRGLGRVDSTEARGTLVAFSTSPGAVAADGRGRNSPFTASLLRHLPTPGLELRSALTRVRAEVAQGSANAQVPWSNDGLLIELFLAGGVARAPTPPGGDALELVFWQSIQSSREAADFAAYLQRFPAGTFAALARNRLEALPRPAASQPVTLSVAPPVPSARVEPSPGAGGFPVGVGQIFRDCEGCPEMVVIPPGRFTMGTPASEVGRLTREGPLREVTMHTSLAVGRDPVTVAEYGAFVTATGRVHAGGCWGPGSGGWEWRPGENWRSPGFQQTDRHPVVCVSWDDAQAYVAWLRQRTGRGYRLLTEAEWEYAVRAGTRTVFWWGADASAQCRYANLADATARQARELAGWSYASCSDGHAYTSPVGSFPPNGFGLRDVAGNVTQWVGDCYGDSYAGASTEASVAVTGADCAVRVARGASWVRYSRFARAGNRSEVTSSYRYTSLGFRVARTHSD